MSTKRKFIPPFGCGDVVKYIGSGPDAWGLYGEEHIIMEIMVDGPTHKDWRYSTNRGAWMNHTEFELVRKVDAESMSQLYKENCDEEESDFEDYEDL